MILEPNLGLKKLNTEIAKENHIMKSETSTKLLHLYINEGMTALSVVGSGGVGDISSRGWVSQSIHDLI